MTAAIKNRALTAEEKSFLQALLYFDIFNYPLTKEELIKFSPSIIIEDATEVLTRLIDQKLVYTLGEFYSLRDDETLAERRIEGNRRATERMSSARKFSKIVAAFPFVKGVMLSGSISKGFMDENSDIDFFIITHPQRLWVVRTSLAFFRRLFLFNSHRNLCTNYFIDTENLIIPDRNYFTAVELCTLVPMYGEDWIQKFQSANLWVKDFLPACGHRIINIKDGNSFLKRTLERILSTKIFSKVNLWLMESTLKYWKRKYAGPLNDNDFEVAFRSRPGVSKSHPQFFQKKVLDRLSQKIKVFEQKHGVDIAL